MNSILKKFKSKDAKALAENFISLSSINLISLIIPIITLPYIIRVIGLENYGILAVATSLITYFITVTDYSFNITATRDVALHKKSFNQLCLIYSKVLTVKFFFAIISFLIILTVVNLIPLLRENFSVFIVVSFQLLANVLFPQWYFQGIEKMKYIAIVKVFIQIIFAVSIFVLIKKESDFILYVMILSASQIFSGLLGQFLLVYKFKLKFNLISFKSFKKTLKSNFPIFVNQLFPTIYNNTSTFLLGFFVTNELVGIYAAIRKIIDICSILLKTFSKVFFPFLSRNHGAFKVYKSLLLKTTLILIILILVSSNLIFWYLSIDWEYSFYILLILSLSLLGFSLYDIYGLNYLIIKHHDKLVMRNTIYMSLISFVLAFPLISYLGIFGGAITLLLARSLMGLGVYSIYKRVSKDQNLLSVVEP